MHLEKLICVTVLAAPAVVRADTLGYTQTNLVSDLPGVAANMDPNLVNPWGISFGPTTPFWISDNGTGLSTLYNGAGEPQSLVVTIPPPSGGTPPAAPTGTIFNGTSTDFMGDKFLFSTEDGTIAGWQGGPTASIRADNSGSDAIYKGLAEASGQLYAANFHAGTVDVFDSNYHQISVAGGFTDPNLPSGYAPFDIQNVNGNLYVTYALQDSNAEDDVPGPGNGYVDVFDTKGNLLQRLVSNGPLNSPWGMALAPSGFGVFSGDLLIGNFGDGAINAFDPASGTFLGTVMNSSGSAITNEGLWGLAFGNGANGFSKNTLYFTAGIPGGGAVEDHGLFGAIAPIPEPATWLLIGAGLLPLVIRRRK